MTGAYDIAHLAGRPELGCTGRFSQQLLKRRCPGPRCPKPVASLPITHMHMRVTHVPFEPGDQSTRICCIAPGVIHIIQVGETACAGSMQIYGDEGLPPAKRGGKLNSWEI